MIFRGENINIGFADAGKQILTDVHFSQQQGQLVAVFGRNGTGKTSLLRCVSGLSSPLSGKVLFNNKNIYSLSGNEKARIISLVLTDRVAPGQMRVSEFLWSGRLPYMNALGKYNTGDEKFIQLAIDKTGIHHLCEKQLQQLSDGEKQKVFIARSLVQDTPVMILDEPTSFLDIPAKNQVIRLLKDLAVNENKLILFSSHDYALSVKHASHIWLLDGNKGLQSGETPALISQTEALLEVNE